MYIAHCKIACERDPFGQEIMSRVCVYREVGTYAVHESNSNVFLYRFVNPFYAKRFADLYAKHLDDGAKIGTPLFTDMVKLAKAQAL